MTRSRKRVLITGGLGFIGQALTRAMIRGNWTVRILDNLTNPSIPPDTARAIGAEVILGDITDSAVCMEAVKRCNAVVHLAGQTYVTHSVSEPYIDLAINGAGSLNLLEASRQTGVETFIAASSNAVAGLHPPPFNELALPRPLSPYGCSKLLMESYCHAYAKMYNIRTVALRFSNIYGPGSWRKGSVVATFMRQALKGEPITVHGDGQQTRDFLFIDDIVLAIDSAMEKGPAGSCFCIASGTRTRIMDLVREIEHLAQEVRGVTLDVRYGPNRDGDIKDNWSDISSAQRVLGFSPSEKLPPGLVKTFSWFISEWLPRYQAEYQAQIPSGQKL